MTGKKSETKTRLLQAARTLYSTYGFEVTTLDDILTASGTTKGAFYHYFKSKESISEAVFEEVARDYKQLTESIDNGAEPIDQLREILAKLIELNASGKWVNCRLMLRFSMCKGQQHPGIQQNIRKFWQWYAGFYEELIETCRHAGQLTAELDAKTQTQLLLSVIAGKMALENTPVAETTLADTIEAIIELLR